jgi:hypothetical protein
MLDDVSMAKPAKCITSDEDNIMILSHIWGLYTHPKTEWDRIDHDKESMFSSLMHVLLLAFIPAGSAYYSAAHIGWQIANGPVITLNSQSALLLAVTMYVALIAGVFALAALIKWMAVTFGAAPSFIHAMELAAYTSTPLFMVGFIALYPELWAMTLAGLAGVAYAVYLLYTGVPIMMHIPDDRGFVYASSVVTCGLVLLVVVMASFAILITNNLLPVVNLI